MSASFRAGLGRPLFATPENRCFVETPLIYVPKSIPHQPSHTSDQSVDLQRRELLEFCERRDWTIVGEFSDIAVSGAKDRRPELDKLMELAKKRKVDVICVWRFDRFARSVSHLLRALELFQSLGIDFVSYTEAIDTSTPVGRMT